jgi:hypothetical protein
MGDFMPVDQGRAWLEYKGIDQAGIYAGITGILVEECRHMHRYAGLTYLIYCAGAARPGYSTFMGHWSGI